MNKNMLTDSTMPPIERFIIDGRDTIDHLRISFVVGLGHAHLEASLRRSPEAPADFIGQVRITSVNAVGTTANQTGVINMASGYGWIERIACLLPEIAASQVGQQGQVRVSCEISISGAILSVGSSGIPSESDLYRRLINEALALPQYYKGSQLPTAARPEGEAAWDAAIKIPSQSMDVKRLRSPPEEAGQINFGRYRFHLPYRKDWSTAKSVISKILLKSATNIIVKIDGRQFGLYSKHGDYSSPGNRYTPTVECMEDVEYLRQLIRSVKKAEPQNVCLDIPAPRI